MYGLDRKVLDGKEVTHKACLSCGWFIGNVMLMCTLVMGADLCGFGSARPENAG